tara:strand:+ start:9197 stop:10168 length:972 start_codon:yes stop_codon:yes gene_type:complete
MRKLLKKFYDNSDVGYLILNPFLKLYNFIAFDFLSDEHILKKKYYKRFRKKLNLRNPRTLNQKILWLKLNDRTPAHTQWADKLRVRELVKLEIGESYLVPLLYTTKDVKNIVEKNLPDEPCIIKTNHDSGGGIFVTNKKGLDYKSIQRKLKRRLKINYYQKSKEWQYKNITPCIVVEKLLVTKNGQIPNDYKLHCFNGKVRMIQVDMGRGTSNHYRNWYNTDWQREPYKWSSPKGPGKYTDPSIDDVPRPETLEKMISLSERISSHFDYVRVDWYDVDGKLYFGEVTFHHDGGTKPILPEQWDLILGNELILTKLKSQDVAKD